MRNSDNITKNYVFIDLIYMLTTFLITHVNKPNIKEVVELLKHKFLKMEHNQINKFTKYIEIYYLICFFYSNKQY